MFIVADSGSTKTDWRLIMDQNEMAQVKSPGINPYYQSSEQILNEQTDYLPESFRELPISMVFYYGAGCSVKDKQDIVRMALEKIFMRSELVVNGDLLGAGRALFKHSTGIACILGTGSGSCLYDGNKIVTNIPSLGFILGDEGSGSYLGRKMLQDYLRGDMPSTISAKLRTQYEVDKEIVLENVNRRPMPGRYLAGFTEFLKSNIKSEYIHGLVADSFNDFVEEYIIKYEDYTSYEIGFVGSIAYHFVDVLREVLEKKNLKPGRIIESPVDDLVNYHRETL